MIGDKLTLVLPDSQVTLAGILPRYKRFTIAGFFEAGSEIDGYLACPLARCGAFKAHSEPSRGAAAADETSSPLRR